MNFSSVFSERFLRAQMRSGDSQRFDVELKDNHHEEQIAEALRIAHDPSHQPTFTVTNSKGTSLYAINDYPTVLVHRAVCAHLQRKFGVRIRDRNSIIRSIVQQLSDTGPLVAIRRDISKFYESIDSAVLRQTLLKETVLAPPLRDKLRSYFDTFCPPSSTGLPRGLAISAVLAELALQDFDSRVRRTTGVYGYERFVDDMIIVLAAQNSQFLKDLEKYLPAPLQFNKRKSIEIDIPAAATGLPYQNPPPSPKWESLDFLGYRIHEVSQQQTTRREARQLSVSISAKKITRLKSRLIRSFLAHRKNSDNALLLDRVQFLTSNYYAYRRGTRTRGGKPFVESGIFYSYRFCGIYSAKKTASIIMPALRDLDTLLRYLVRGRNSEFRSHLQRTLSKQGTQRILTFSFQAGFNRRLVVRFSRTRLAQIQEAWRHE